MKTKLLSKIVSLFGVSLLLTSCGEVSKEEFKKRVEEKESQGFTHPVYKTITISGKAKVGDKVYKPTENSYLLVEGVWEDISLARNDPLAETVFNNSFFKDYHHLSSNYRTLIDDWHSENATYYIFGYKRNYTLRGFDIITDEEKSVEMRWDDNFFLTNLYDKSVIDNVEYYVDVKLIWRT